MQANRDGSLKLFIIPDDSCTPKRCPMNLRRAHPLVPLRVVRGFRQK
jgi:hypothetical protein